MPAADEQRGALTWRYVGQARYQDNAPPVRARWVREAPDTRSTVEMLLDTTRTDDLGRRWQVVAVDVDLLNAQVDAYDLASGEPDIERHPVDEPYGEPGPEEEYWWEPHAWYQQYCSYGNHNTYYYRWNADSRNSVTAPLTLRQQAIVQVLSEEEGGCTGVMVDHDTVLTAAHCVTYDGTGQEFPYVQVCTWGNAYSGAECKNTSNIVPAPGWSGSGTNNDYALVHLPSGWSNHNQYMLMSGASDSFILDKKQHNLAHPEWGTDCDWPVVNGYWGPWYSTGTKMYHHRADILNLTANRIKTNHDGGDGHSGGPFYYCGGYNCGPGDPGYITGVWSAFYPGDPFASPGMRGPKGSKIRQWVISNL